MSVMDRLLLLLLALGGLCASIVLFLLGIGVGTSYLSSGYGILSFPQNAYAIIIAIVFAIVSVRFLFYRVRGRQAESVVLPGEHGFIRISFDTVRELANRSGKGIRGVQDFDTRVHHSQNGIALSVRVKATPDIELAKMSQEVQTTVKAYVEHTAGVTVERVTVHVSQLGNGNSSKTQRTWVE